LPPNAPHGSIIAFPTVAAATAEASRIGWGVGFSIVDRRGAIGILGALVVGSLVVSGLAVSPPGFAAGPWVPRIGLHWQYQLQGAVRTNLCVVPVAGGSCVHPDVYDVDLYAPDGVHPNTHSVAAVHATGAHAVCYVDAGTWENFRPDAGKYPASVKGLPNGWPGERWLDVRATGVLLPIITARVDKCATAGFDAVEFDNVDGYTNKTGFPFTATDQLKFNTDLAAIAHKDNLSVGLKNDLGQLSQLGGSFDFAINEQCAQFHECGAYDPWTAAGKAVFEVEYQGQPSVYCPPAGLHGRDAAHKSLGLWATPWKPCR
jgi:hypothetical protein